MVARLDDALIQAALTRRPGPGPAAEMAVDCGEENYWRYGGRADLNANRRNVWHQSADFVIRPLTAGEYCGHKGTGRCDIEKVGRDGST